MRFTKVSVFPTDILLADFECKYKNAEATLIPTDKDGRAGKHCRRRLDDNGKCQFRLPLSSTFVDEVKFCYLRVIVYGPAGTKITVDGGLQMLSIRADVFELRKEFRIVELKDGLKLQCPMCKSSNTIVVESLHGKPDMARWFYHDCNECEFSNALSDGFIVAEPDGSLTVCSTQS